MRSGVKNIRKGYQILNNIGETQKVSLQKEAMKDKHACNYNKFGSFRFIAYVSAKCTFVVLIITLVHKLCKLIDTVS
jgi:hypothetical protein